MRPWFERVCVLCSEHLSCPIEVNGAISAVEDQEWLKYLTEWWHIMGLTFSSWNCRLSYAAAVAGYEITLSLTYSWMRKLGSACIYLPSCYFMPVFWEKKKNKGSTQRISEPVIQISQIAFLNASPSSCRRAGEERLVRLHWLWSEE